MTQQLALGIDIGGTNTALGLVSRQGKILASYKMATAGYSNVEEYVSELSEKIALLVSNYDKNSILGVGIGAPNGNYYTGEIAFAPNLPWHGIIPLTKLMGESTGLPATLTNDAKAAAIGEQLYGAAKGMNNFIEVTLGTGLGSGFVANAKLIYGHDGFAGELGHVTAVRDGRECNCGRKGCLERYASATGIVITAKLWLNERNDETCLRNNTTEITAEDISIAAKNGDLFALEVFDYTGKILGQCLADTVAVTSPEAIILFGGLANSGALLITPTKKYMEQNLLPIYKNKVAIIQSALPGADAAILGASALAFSEFANTK